MQFNPLENWVSLNKVYFESIEQGADPIMREHRTWHYEYNDDMCNPPNNERICLICDWVYHKDTLFLSEEFEEEFARKHITLRRSGRDAQGRGGNT